MAAEELLREGKLDEALKELQSQVRNQPGNGKYRVFLFQLLAIMGDYHRALTQLNVAGELDPANLAMVQTYREALACELFRREVFAGKQTPLLFGEPEPWVAQLVNALGLFATNQHQAASALWSQAFDSAPATSGQINGEGFEWIADGDSRLGPILEVIVNGRYFWIPFSRIKLIEIEPPADLRDLVWIPARFVWANGGEAFGLIPTRYPDSETAADSAIQLSRKTEWLEKSDGVYQGIGQRLLATDQTEYPLLEVRRVELQV